MSDPTSNDAPWLRTQTFLLLLAATLLAVFPEVALGAKTFFARDFGALGYPGTVFLRNSFLHGELPLWDPYSHCGVPYLAQMGQWYPPTLLSVFLPLPWAENALMLVHLWFGGFGMFWLLRRWNAGNLAAAFGAYAFVFNGVTLSCLQWGNYIAALAWLPWVIGCTVEAWRHGGRWLPLAALSSALQVLTATPEITLLVWLFLGAIWFSDVIAGDAPFWTSTQRISVVVILAAGLTMVQMLPFFDLLAHSQRTAGQADSTVWSMPGWGWANLLAPLFHCFKSPQGQWFQNGQEFLPSYYPGLGLLTLAIAAALFIRTRLALIVSAMILFCWVLAPGDHSPFYVAAKKLFPPITIARFPIKFAILPAFLLPLLAAWEIDRLRKVAGDSRRLAIIAGVVLLLLAGIVWWAKQYPLPLDDWAATASNAAGRAAFLAAMLALLFLLQRLKDRTVRVVGQILVLVLLPLDALTHSPKIAPTLPASVLAPGLWQLSQKSPPPRLGEGRIMTSPDAEQKLLYSRVADFQSDFIGKRVAQWYNLNLLDDVPKVTGAVTLRPARFDVLERYIYYNTNGRCSMGLADFLSVQWLSAPANPTLWQPRTTWLPMVTAGQKPISANDEKTLTAITADDFNPRETVYLPETENLAATNKTDCTVTNVHVTLNRVTADVVANAPVLVVISQNYYHLWQPDIDGRPARLLRANLAFQAIEVPAGSHHIQLVYRDPFLKAGAIVSLLSLVVCGLLWRRNAGLRTASKNM